MSSETPPEEDRRRAEVPDDDIAGLVGPITDRPAPGRREAVPAFEQRHRLER